MFHLPADQLAREFLKNIILRKVAIMELSLTLEYGLLSS